MGPTPVYGARTEKTLQNADFAMKQTNICRLSGDINNVRNFVAIAPLRGRDLDKLTNLLLVSVRMSTSELINEHNTS